MIYAGIGIILGAPTLLAIVCTFIPVVQLNADFDLSDQGVSNWVMEYPGASFLPTVTTVASYLATVLILVAYLLPVRMFSLKDVDEPHSKFKCIFFTAMAVTIYFGAALMDTWVVVTR